MKLRPSLLMLTAVAAGLSAVTNALTAATPAPAPASAPAEQTRLGASIQQDLTARDRESARRARALELREQAAKAAEQRLQAAGGAAAPGARRGGAAAAAPSEDEQYAELARIYQAMKPKAAALVFEQLAMDVQVEVAQRMRERATASILAAMTPKGAAALTMAIARRQTVIAPPAPPPPAPAASPKPPAAAAR